MPSFSIGDSVSIMYTEPYLIDALADVALVQHAPWGGDGGAEETAYAAQCLGYFTSSPSGVALHPDLVMFNSGMHSGPVWNVTGRDGARRSGSSLCSVIVSHTCGSAWTK